MHVTHFASVAEFHRWLEQHATSHAELIVGFFKKDSGQGGLTYPEALDEALCFGWIDGVRRRLDVLSFSVRFTPRKPGSIWSNVNVAHVARLISAGRMKPAGLAAFATRSAKKTGVYSFEIAPKALTPVFAKKFRARRITWAFFSAQPPSYRRRAVHLIMSPKQAATRERWLDRVIAESTAGRRLP